MVLLLNGPSTANCNSHAAQDRRSSRSNTHDLGAPSPPLPLPRDGRQAPCEPIDSRCPTRPLIAAAPHTADPQTTLVATAGALCEKRSGSLGVSSSLYPTALRTPRPHRAHRPNLELWPSSTQPAARCITITKQRHQALFCYPSLSGGPTTTSPSCGSPCAYACPSRHWMCVCVCVWGGWGL